MFEVGARVRFKENYTTDVGIIITSCAVGTVVRNEIIDNVTEIEVHFYVEDKIILPIIKHFGIVNSPSSVFDLMFRVN